MTAYTTADALRVALKQSTKSVSDADLEDVVVRASAIIDEYIGFSFDGYSETTRVFHTDGTSYLRVDPYQEDSIVSVTQHGSTSPVTDYEEEGNATLYRADKWTARRYDVTAAFGYGLPPASVEEVALQISVNLWQSRMAGQFTDVIGVDNGDGTKSIARARALTDQQRMVLDSVRARVVGAVVP